MKRIQIYDPPMCCSTGVCGPSVDPILARFTGLLNHLAHRGVAVERFNLAQQPIAFVENAAVKELLDREGVNALPLVYCDGELALKGTYFDETQWNQWRRDADAMSTKSEKGGAV